MDALLAREIKRQKVIPAVDFATVKSVHVGQRMLRKHLKLGEEGRFERFEKCRSTNHRSRLLAPLCPHGKLARDQIAERITHMRALGIRFIKFDEWILVRIRFPGHLL